MHSKLHCHHAPLSLSIQIDLKQSNITQCCCTSTAKVLTNSNKQKYYRRSSTYLCSRRAIYFVLLSYIKYDIQMQCIVMVYLVAFVFFAITQQYSAFFFNFREIFLYVLFIFNSFSYIPFFAIIIHFFIHFLCHVCLPFIYMTHIFVVV